MLICKEEDDQTTTDEESPAKRKKDPHKVDKKFLWPHGITPPLKNVRKRRFRKTLKKKYVEAPEIEKEVCVSNLLLFTSVVRLFSLKEVHFRKEKQFCALCFYSDVDISPATGITFRQIVAEMISCISQNTNFT